MTYLAEFLFPVQTVAYSASVNIIPATIINQFSPSYTQQQPLLLHSCCIHMANHAGTLKSNNMPV